LSFDFSKRRWRKTATGRINKPDYAERAVFEALVNALIHRDYSVLGSEVHINLYDNRLVISSPGGMFDGTLIQNRKIDEVPSSRRNPVLADVFAQLNYMEKRGSGLRKICNESAKLPGYTTELEPRFKSEATVFFTKIINVNWHESQNGESNEREEVGDVIENVTEEISDVIENVTEEVGDVTEIRRRKILDLIRNNNKISTFEIASEMRVTRRTIARDMIFLKDKNIISRIGPDKGGHWKINQDNV